MARLRALSSFGGRQEWRLLAFIVKANDELLQEQVEGKCRVYAVYAVYGVYRVSECTEYKYMLHEHVERECKV